jgi:molybdopterin/thiamine biosynthesis adenylyltransferase
MQSPEGPAQAPSSDFTFDAERYSRQVLFRPLGASGQHRLTQAHAVIVGVGATGAASASLLARAGVGRLTLIDRDFVEPSNLQRQVLFDESDAAAALPKAEAARRHIAAFNSAILVTANVADLVPGNIHELLASADIVLDGTDNFETRYLLNDYAVSTGTPWIYAAAVGSYAATMNILPLQGSSQQETGSSSGVAAGLSPRYEGGQENGALASGIFAEATRSSPSLPETVSSHLSFRPERAARSGENPAFGEASAEGTSKSTLFPIPYSLFPTSCLSCLFPAAPQGNTETCDTAGILSTAVNFAASLQVTEALKYLSGNAAAMRRTLLSYDLWTGDRSELSATSPDPACEVCGQRRFRYLAGENRPQITLCGRNSVQIHEHHRPVDLVALRSRLEPLGSVRSNGLLLRFERAPHTLTVFPDGRALIQGTTDVALARSLYARFIGA